MFKIHTSDPDKIIFEPKKALTVLKKLLTIRKFEEKSVEMYKQGLMGGSLHGYIGQEAVAVGVCEHLKNDDYMGVTYRSRGQAIAKGASIEKLFAEMMGRADGYCKGKGGPMHIADMSIGLIGANGIVGAGIPIATGAAFTAKRRKKGQVAVTFFGDGATNQGVFHETLNMASIWELPIIYVCENNLYSEMSPIKNMVKNNDLAERALAYHIHSVVVDGNDVEAVSQVTQEAVERARKGLGPTFIEAKTYRQQGHMFGDSETYRSKEEVNEWKKRDPILLFTKKLTDLGVMSYQQIESLSHEIDQRIEEAYQNALNSPVADYEEIFTDVY
ncbi:thiamine pyrophosphate-dependent dehydrogenase E1 component subunit alpha [Bacillus alveayuensis]|uniref:thiamine pyrophosphate-dependent dehydrogenase E1 component subunit alpha n=1 Tax=Aeribacillus alveayuensis TaxID=279215 RepID=UPI000A02B558|nr:thiamine pyrophosphate-dependent dehydrogenase E1 component subunit alpha [Bacillus alveayuensis]